MKALLRDAQQCNKEYVPTSIQVYKDAQVFAFKYIKVIEVRLHYKSDLMWPTLFMALLWKWDESISICVKQHKELWGRAL